MVSSSVLAQYPNLAPGLCGRLECPRICVRGCHCDAGLRRRKSLLNEQAKRRMTVKPTRRALYICDQIQTAGQCPSLCWKVGGCFMPQVDDHPSESKRKAFRPQRAMDLLVAHRQRQRAGIEAQINRHAPPEELPRFNEQLRRERAKGGIR